jgi:hypothetical protein
VAVGQDESIAIDPVRVAAAVSHYFGPEQVGHGGAAHERIGMARVGSLRLVGRDGLNRIDAQKFGRRSGNGHDDWLSKCMALLGGARLGVEYAAIFARAGRR